LVNCPKCGRDVPKPVKTWPIPSQKPLKEGEGGKLIAIFECPSCKARFRSVVKPEGEIQDTASIKNMVGRIRGIKEELMQTLTNLREKIRTLETERASLMMEIQNLRKVAESRAEALESEVSMLREEVRSLKDILGYAVDEK
jgi:hypothetical protein